jgi:hypothetical protein
MMAWPLIGLAMALLPILDRLIGSDGEPAPRLTLGQVAQLPRIELETYIRRLVRENDLEALECIAMRKELQGSNMAAAAYTSNADPTQAVVFCTRFEVQTGKWQNAFWGLQHQPKEKVIGYIKQIATSSDREARFLCYGICLSRGWPDLLELAKKEDKNDNTQVLVQSAGFGESVGAVVREYIKRFDK